MTVYLVPTASRRWINIQQARNSAAWNVRPHNWLAWPGS